MLNQFTGIGRWCKENDLRYSQGGTAINKNTIALDRYAKQGEEKKTDFLPVVMLGKLAENVAAHSGKGRLVCVTGKVQTRSWEKDGQKRYATEILADGVKFLDYPKDKPAQGGIATSEVEDMFGGTMEGPELPF